MGWLSERYTEEEVVTMKAHKFTEGQQRNLLQWAEWLETTEFAQGKEALKRNTLEEEWDDEAIDDPDGDGLPVLLGENPTGPPEFCCLGIYVEYKNPKRFTDMDEFNGEWLCPQQKDANWRYNTSYLPTGMARELGIYTGGNEPNNLQDLFITLNDDWDMPFPEIAEEVRSLATTGRFRQETLDRIYC